MPASLNRASISDKSGSVLCVSFVVQCPRTKLPVAWTELFDPLLMLTCLPCCAMQVWHPEPDMTDFCRDCCTVRMLSGRSRTYTTALLVVTGHAKGG
ncbi:MAG: hypothetical protein R3C59_00010 [Planctomycetaceae bacterium]